MRSLLDCSATPNLADSQSSHPTRILAIALVLCYVFTPYLAEAENWPQLISQDASPNIPVAPAIPSINGLSLASAPSTLPNKKIGVVKALRGKWCRNGSVLQEGAELFWEDDVHYCLSPVVREDQIEIIFDREPPFGEVYGCSSPGICGKREKLWLQGAYTYGQTTHSFPDILLSSPKLRSSVLPDVVIPAGSNLDILPVSIVAAIKKKSFVVCPIALDWSIDCSTEESHALRLLHKPGLYGLYNIALRGNAPSALMLLTDAHSTLPERWTSVPFAFRADATPTFVEERRLFLLDLYKSDATITESTDKK